MKVLFVLLVGIFALCQGCSSSIKAQSELPGQYELTGKNGSITLRLHRDMHYEQDTTWTNGKRAHLEGTWEYDPVIGNVYLPHAIHVREDSIGTPSGTGGDSMPATTSLGVICIEADSAADSYYIKVGNE